jgi:hypothetical protein
VRSDSVFFSASLQAHLALVLLCGISLALSIQPASELAALRTLRSAQLPYLFHVFTVFVFGLFAVSRGAVLAANTGPRILRVRPMLHLLSHLGCGVLLLLPYFVYSRALLPGRGATLFVLLVYMTTMALFFSLASFRLGVRGHRNNRDAFLARYGVYVLFCLLPLGVGVSHPSLSTALAVSPIGFVMEIIAGPSTAKWFIGFCVPLLGILWMLTRLRQVDGRYHAI